MYIFKNALRSITRSKVRSVLISIIILVISVSTCVALSIREAANTARETLLEDLEVTASITFNRSAMMNNMSAGDGDKASGGFDKDSFKEQMADFSSSPDLDELTVYSENENVKSFYYTISTSVNGTDSFEAVDTTGSSTDTSDTEAQADASDTDDTENEQRPDMDSAVDNGNMGGGRFGTQGDFTVTGYSSDRAMTDFIDGNSSIVEGSVFEEGTTDNDCIIPEELATYNSISVGDSITVSNPNNEDETITLNVVGIYSGAESSGSEISGFSVFQDSANKILMSYNALKAITDESSESSDNALAAQTNGTYTFADVDAYEAFCEEVYDMGLSEEYTVESTDYNAYEQSLQPIENLSTYALYFLIVVLIIGGIILVVINIFNIRERKYEIGVMAAIGMKKSKVALQFISEMLIITLITVIVGTGIGAAVSVPIGDALLSSQTESLSEQDNRTNESFGRDFVKGGSMMQDNSSGESTEQPSPTDSDNGINSLVNDISTSTNMTVFLQLMGIAILLSLIASGVSVIFVLRYDPLKILSNRD